MSEELLSFEEGARAVLARTFGGFHNVPGKVKQSPGMWEVNVYCSLATYDFCNLTWLVFAAHEFCVRVEIQASGPRRLKILLHPRKRVAETTYERHPTIEVALERFKEGTAMHRAHVA